MVQILRSTRRIEYAETAVVACRCCADHRIPGLTVPLSSRTTVGIMLPLTLALLEQRFEAGQHVEVLGPSGGSLQGDEARQRDVSHG